VVLRLQHHGGAHGHIAPPIQEGIANQGTLVCPLSLRRGGFRLVAGLHRTLRRAGFPLTLMVGAFSFEVGRQWQRPRQCLSCAPILAVLQHANMRTSTVFRKTGTVFSENSIFDVCVDYFSFRSGKGRESIFERRLAAE
jgi:hypothetical protein